MTDESIGPRLPVKATENSDGGTNENDTDILAEYKRTLQALDQEEAKHSMKTEDSSGSDEESDGDEPMDDQLSNFSLEAVLNYLKSVRSNPKTEDPSEVVTLYEQALKLDSENPDLWMEFADYLDKNLKDYKREINVFERALKACPGYIPLVQNALLAHERAGTDLTEIQEIFEEYEDKVESPDDGINLYTTFIYLCRRAGVSHDDLDILFNLGMSNLEEYFGNHWDYDARFRRNYAYFSYSKNNNPTQGAKIWRGILKCGMGNKAEPWLEAIRLERHFGTVENARKLLYEAVNSVTDSPNDVFTYFVQFEREEGNRDQVDKALAKINNRFHKLQEQQTQWKGRRDGGKQKDKGNSVNGKRTPVKRKLEGRRPEAVKPKRRPELTLDKDGFVVPTIPSARSQSSSPAPKSPKCAISAEFSNEKPILPNADSTDLSGKASDSPPVSADTGKSAEGDPERTVFLSNIDFSWNEGNVRQIIPNAQAIRMPMRTKAQSKGYAYVDFATKEEAKAVLANDGKFTSKGRPVHISPYAPHAKSEKAPFMFRTEKEENKLFVRNVHFDATNGELQELFEKHGPIKSVRIVTRPNGQPRGFAYVEFENSKSAKSSLELDGHKLHGRKLKVLISDPSVVMKPQNAEAGESSGEQQRAKKTTTLRGGDTNKTSVLSFKPRPRILLDKK